MARYSTIRSVVAVVVLGACARTTSQGPSQPVSASPSSVVVNQTGESSSRRAVEGFMRAVNAQDLQQMSILWGTSKGPARDLFKRDELEKRLIVIQCLLAHDSWSFPEESPRMQTGGRQEYLVEVHKKSIGARTTFTMVQGPAQRWYVEIVNVEPLREFCR